MSSTTNDELVLQKLLRDLLTGGIPHTTGWIKGRNSISFDRHVWYKMFPEATVGEGAREKSEWTVTDEGQLDELVRMQDLVGARANHGWVGDGSRAWGGGNYYRMYALHLDTVKCKDGFYTLNVHALIDYNGSCSETPYNNNKSKHFFGQKFGIVQMLFVNLTTFQSALGDMHLLTKDESTAWIITARKRLDECSCRCLQKSKCVCKSECECEDTCPCDAECVCIEECVCGSLQSLLKLLGQANKNTRKQQAGGTSRPYAPKTRGSAVGAIDTGDKSSVCVPKFMKATLISITKLRKATSKLYSKFKYGDVGKEWGEALPVFHEECETCARFPITPVLYKCKACSVSLCEKCANNHTPRTHDLLMIRESKKLKLHKESPVYTVESIDGWEIRGKLLWFLVRWQGYSVPLWQLASELGNDENCVRPKLRVRRLACFFCGCRNESKHSTAHRCSPCRKGKLSFARTTTTASTTTSASDAI